VLNAIDMFFVSRSDDLMVVHGFTYPEFRIHCCDESSKFPTHILAHFKDIFYCDGDCLSACGYIDSTMTEVLICVQCTFLNMSFNVPPNMKSRLLMSSVLGSQ
jgi:hypothetical protein